MFGLLPLYIATHLYFSVCFDNLNLLKICLLYMIVSHMQLVVLSSTVFHFIDCD